jgi:hypothetical protein
MSPYKDIEKSENLIVRKFSQDIDPIELMWHRDLKNREIKLISGKDWKLQMENELPKDISVNLIPKLSWHRVIKGEGDLVIGIREWD